MSVWQGFIVNSYRAANFFFLTLHTRHFAFYERQYTIMSLCEFMQSCTDIFKPSGLNFLY